MSLITSGIPCWCLCKDNGVSSTLEPRKYVRHDCCLCFRNLHPLRLNLYRSWITFLYRCCTCFRDLQVSSEKIRFMLFSWMQWASGTNWMEYSGWVPKLSWHYAEEENVCFYQESNSRTLFRPACSLVSLLTELPRLPFWINEGKNTYILWRTTTRIPPWLGQAWPSFTIICKIQSTNCLRFTSNVS